MSMYMIHHFENPQTGIILIVESWEMICELRNGRVVVERELA